MYSIALCDDKEEELDKVEDMLEIYQKEHRECVFLIRRFQRAEELIGFTREKEYRPDLVIMDVFMPGKLGVDAAEELREMGIGCQIIFLTVSREYALQAFQVDAVQYLLKPVAQDKLFQVLDNVWKDWREAEKKYLVMKIGSSICRMRMQDITYVEAQKKCQCLYLSDGTQYMLRLTMAKIYEMLCEYEEFVKVGISYIVNLIHVTSISAQMIQLDNGSQIYLPRGSYPVLKEQYFRYYCKED